MTLIRVNRNQNRENGNTNRNLPSMFDRETSFPGLFNSFARPFLSRSMFDDFFGDDLAMGNIGTTIPAVNIEETDTDLVINVAAPGMNKKDFKVELDNNQLHIAYKKESRNENNNEGQQKNEGSHWRREYNF